MPITHNIWRIGDPPQPLATSALVSENQLEDMIVAAPEILSDDWMIIGRQVNTGVAGRIDLLAIAPDGNLVLIELKRDRTPRDVVAQALDYAAWLEDLAPADINRIYAAFSNGRDLGHDFRARFGEELDEDTLNDNHEIVVVAASLDASTERMVDYLNRRDIPINILFFQVFAAGDQQLLSRAWLHDPVETQVAASGGAPKARAAREPWNGEFYVSYGHGPTRSWAEARQHGFICGGGGTWYTGTLRLLGIDDRVWVKAPGYGYVGVGRVTGPATLASQFTLTDASGAPRPALDVLTAATYHRQFVDDPAKSEWFVPIRWLDTVPLERALNETGLFGNQNTVCRPTTPGWSTTVERLKQVFTRFDAS